MRQGLQKAMPLRQVQPVMAAHAAICLRQKELEGQLGKLRADVLWIEAMPPG